MLIGNESHHTTYSALSLRKKKGVPVRATPVTHHMLQKIIRSVNSYLPLLPTLSIRSNLVFDLETSPVAYGSILFQNYNLLILYHLPYYICLFSKTRIYNDKKLRVLFDYTHSIKKKKRINHAQL